ncbi:MAG: glycoside hydrolase family 31 protein [Candidatus Didemnitutus sp.]|nr:glycoside hydrolase family 31 protein [Candidatus Didemnitutus sp.]
MRLPVYLLASACLAAPTTAPALDWAGLQPLAAVASVQRTAAGLDLICADGATVHVSVLAPDLIRVRALFAGQPASLDHSWAIARTDWAAPPWHFAETATELSLTTAAVKVVIQRDPLLIAFHDAVTGRVINADARPMARDPATGRLAAAKHFGFEEHFYGLGEKAARLDKRRGRFVMWNSDTPGYVEGRDPIYQSIPFYLGWEEGRAYGLFYDNTYRTTFDLGHTGQDYAAFGADGGELNYYFFAGPSLKQIVSRYTELTGRMPLPPLWALGHQQSRYSYYPDTVVEKVAEQYRARDLPLDVLYLDIHYMDAYRVFTWDRTRFPDPSGLMKRLAEKGLRVVTIVDPGVKYQPPVPGAIDPATDRDLASSHESYYVYNEGLAGDYFLRQKDGSLYIGEVWPGQSVFVDYTRADARQWWGEGHRALTERGVAGIWTDMNEPADFLDQTGERHKDIVFDDLGQRAPYAKHRNTFALLMARATYEGLEQLQPDRRPFVITRAGSAGIQRYAVKWTGDNNATFDSLALNIPMFASLGISGQAFVGADIPGFIGRGDGELLARAYQMATFVPFCRNHSAIDQYDKEPWRFGSYYEGIVRKYLKLRYRMLPFLYTTLEEAHRTGVPLFRPLLLNFQEDYNTVNLDDQFMIGDALLAAPVVRAGERAREVYFPAGRWYEFETGAIIRGGTTLRVDAPLDHMPLYVRGGSIVPSTIAMNYTDEKPWNPLRFDIYPDDAGTANGSLYEDDGHSPDYKHGAWRRTTLHFANGQLTLTPTGTHAPGVRNFAIVLHRAAAVQQVLVDGVALEASAWTRAADHSLTVALADNGRARQLEFR